MTSSELGNNDVPTAIKAQLENSEDKTITVATSVGDRSFYIEITVSKEAWDNLVRTAAFEVKCSIEDEEDFAEEPCYDIAYHLECRGITMESILDQCDKLQSLHNSIKVAMCRYNDADDDISSEQAVFIHDEYPQILLDEIANQTGISAVFDEDKSLRQVLADNELDDENEEYRVYSPDNKGCSKEHPFFINEPVGFISLEKELIQYLFTECPNRNVKYKFIRQSYILLGEQHLDKLTYKVTEPTTKKTHIEDYWFDITAGMLNAARKDGIKC